MSLIGKIAIITGGAKGIGYACCEALGKAGAQIMVADIDEDAVDAAVRQLGKSGVHAAGGFGGLQMVAYGMGPEGVRGLSVPFIVAAVTVCRWV